MVLITKLDSYAYSPLELLYFHSKFTFITTVHNCSSKSIYNKIKRGCKLNQMLRPADANKPISFHFTALAMQ